MPITKAITQHFYVKQSDTGKPLPVTLSGTATLAGATVRFSMRPLNADLTYGTIKVNRQTATIDDAVARKVHYDWGGTDLDTPGDFAFEFEVTYAGGRVETHPNRDDHIAVVHVAQQVA